jgi:hypothetical protein
LKNWLNQSSPSKTILGKGGETPPHLLFYLDTDPKASPFDICMAYDAGYNAVIPYENVTAEDGKTIVLDALLSRGPKGAKNTVFMIGGKNAEKAEAVFEAVKGAMFPPFKGNIIVDADLIRCCRYGCQSRECTRCKQAWRVKDKTCAIMGTEPSVKPRHSSQRWAVM